MRDARTAAIAVLLACLLAPGISTSAAAADAAAELKAGMVLGPDTYQAAKDLLPPEILKHYQAGEYKNVIVDYPVGSSKWEPAWKDATEKNAGQLDVDDVGTIIFKGTGKQPDYLYGFPFPTIDPNDPKAAVKVVWNQFLSYWSGGSSFNDSRVVMLQPKGLDRDIHADGYFNFWDGQGEKYRKPNPNNLQSQFLGVSTFPADLQGTASLSWRYRDPSKRDSVWAFLPALRRVRAVSPANRSDGYLGSDISGDDGFFFDGKPEDFEWKLIGQRDALRVVDPNTVKGDLKIPRAPGGGFSVLINDDNKPMVGFEDPNWTGLSWAPLPAGLAKRPVWIVEGTPKDRYYLYGKIQLWIDAETWDGSWNIKYSWQGEVVHSYQTMARINQQADNGEVMPASTTVWACAENFKMNRATLGGMRARPKAPFLRRPPIDPNLFDSQALARYGK
ncbi:MAG TPA: DUF1329 domain-containing protein [Candidatus Dormibacteraeota bacterium]|nr:DUF1329 domain-containing protein [Candidatus Dormibacteraeota bacterium]